MFSKWLQKSLDEIGMSQSELARRLGTHRITVNKIIKDRRKTTAEELLAIEKIVGKKYKPLNASVSDEIVATIEALDSDDQDIVADFAKKLLERSQKL